MRNHCPARLDLYLFSVTCAYPRGHDGVIHRAMGAEWGHQRDYAEDGTVLGKTGHVAVKYSLEWEGPASANSWLGVEEVT